MARRRFRRFNRVSPDMGWFVTTDALSWSDGPGTIGDGTTVFNFDDITESDGALTRDKSDWFVKRVLVDAYPSWGPGFPRNIQADAARIWTFAIGTVDNHTIADWLVNQSFALMTPSGYEMWARLFRMYTRPVYRTWTPRVNEVTGSLMTDESTGATAGYYANSTPWGESCIRDDFTVSNAGVKPQQSLVVACSGHGGPGTYDWQAGDEFHLLVVTRTLLQKRRDA